MIERRACTPLYLRDHPSVFFGVDPQGDNFGVIGPDVKTKIAGFRVASILDWNMPAPAGRPLPSNSNKRSCVTTLNGGD